MTSNTRLSILKPGRPREPLQDLSQLIPNNEEEETTTDNHKRRVSFAAVNKVKEFETGAECTTLHQTPAYDERFSMSSDSYQSSISEYSHNKSTFITSAEASVTMNYSKINDENINIVEVVHNVSRGAPSPGKMSAGDSSMDITSVIVRDEHEYIDYDSSSETYYPLNLTKSRQSTQSIGRPGDDEDKDILETSSMETTEALPCFMTETIVTDFESFNQTMDVSVEEVGVEEENNYRLSMNTTTGPEKIFHLRESTALVSEKDIRFTVDVFGEVKDTRVQENIFVEKQVVSVPTVESSAMEEDTSLNFQNRIVDKENLMMSGNTGIEDGDNSQLEETEIVEREMDISLSKSFIPAKETFCLVSNITEEITEKDMKCTEGAIEIQEKDTIPSESINLEEKNTETVENVIAEEQNPHFAENVEKEDDLLPAKNITIEMEKDPPLVESILEDEKHSQVESIITDKNEQQAIETAIIEDSAQSQKVENSIAEEKEQLPSVQTAAEEDDKQLNPVQNSVAEEKEQLEPVQIPVEKDEEQLEFIQIPVLLEPAENPVTEESNLLHDEILSVELQNCQLIENASIEEEENLHPNENKTEEEIPVTNAASVEIEIPPSPKNVSSSEKTVSEEIVAENSSLENEISLHETSAVEMENVYEVENFDKNDDINIEPSEKCTENLSNTSSRPLKRKSDSFVPEIPPPEPSPKRLNTEINLEIVQKNETIRKQIEEAIKSKEIPCWTVVSSNDTEWKFGTLWNRLHLVITLPQNDTKCISKLRFIKKDSEIGDEILKVAIAPIIRKYRKKMDELCGKVEDVAIFMKMTLSSINFAERFAEDFSQIMEFESISLDNGFASFLVANYKSHLLAKVQVDMRNIEDFSDSSLEVIQNIGKLDETLVRRIFFEARGDFDFFSKFVNNLNRELNC